MPNKSDTIIAKMPKWQKEALQLREILLSYGLKEDLKWQLLHYTYDGSTIVGIKGFRNYCSLVFDNGHLMRDPQGILVKPTDRIKHIGRQKTQNDQIIY